MSHDQEDWQEYKKKHPEEVKPKAKTDPKKERGRERTRDKGKQRSPSGSRSRSQSSRSAATPTSRGGSAGSAVSNPPGKACKWHVLFLVHGGTKCKRGDECKFAHGDQVTSEEKEWAKRHQKNKPRRNSPGKPSAAVRSGSSSRESSKPKKKKKEKGQEEQEGLRLTR